MADAGVTERSYPFAAGPGAVVTEDDWSAMVSAWQDNGVHGDPSTPALTVMPGPTQNTIQIHTGSAGLLGFTYSLTAPKVMSTTTNPGGSSRTDLVALRRDAEAITAVILVNANMSALTNDMIPLALWTQLPDSSATSSNWGSAVDRRWFSGSRVRPSIEGAEPPVTIGGLMYRPGESGPGSILLGENVLGTPTWVPWASGGSTVPVPRAWSAYGHSYLAQNSGGLWNSSRLDVMFRNMVGINPSDFQNYGVWASAINQDGRKAGGWTRVLQELTRPVVFNSDIHGAPYFPDGGAYLFCWGINDLGFTPSTQTSICLTYQNTLRALISRARASVIWEDSYSPALNNNGKPVYGAGFTQTANTAEFSSGTTLRDATATGATSTVTLTLPPDYMGEPVFIQFIANVNGKNGTVTFTGTAGVTGTFSITNPLTNVRVPVVKRLTNLTAANAGQTIVFQVTSLESGGAVRFDSWGLESKTPVPVIVCNTPRVMPAGYAGYTNTIGDAEVAALNTAVSSVVAEFGGMVQIADLDSALNKNAANFAADGLHPNEFGAARAANAVLDAVNSLSPTDPNEPYINTASLPLSAGLIKPRIKGNYYTTEYTASASMALAAVPSGSMWAVPFVVTEGRGTYIRPSLQVASVTGSFTVRIGIYDDVAWSGYPQVLLAEDTSGGVYGPLVAGLNDHRQNTFYLNQGLYWLVVKITAVGTAISLQGMTGPDRTGVMPLLGASPGAATMALNTTPIGWTLTGQGTGVLPNIFPGGAAIASTAPMIALLKAT